MHIHVAYKNPCTSQTSRDSVQIFLPVFARCQTSCQTFLQQTEAPREFRHALISADNRKMLQFSGVILLLLGQSPAIT